MDGVLLWERTVTVRLRRVAPATEGVAAEAFSVEGEVEAEDGNSTAVAGWLGLVNHLERLLTASPADR